MIRHRYTYQELGCIDAYLECAAHHPNEMTVSGVFENERGGANLLRSSNARIRLIAGCVGDAAQEDAAFIARVWEAQEEARPEIQAGRAEEAQYQRAAMRREMAAE